MMTNDAVRSDMQLTLGPVLFNWKPDAWLDFYYSIAEESVIDTVVIGEIVCSKRAPFLKDHMPSAVARLLACGKQVILVSLTLM